MSSVTKQKKDNWNKKKNLNVLEDHNWNKKSLEEKRWKVLFINHEYIYIYSLT